MTACSNRAPSRFRDREIDPVSCRDARVSKTKLLVEKAPSLLSQDLQASIVPHSGQKSCSKLGCEPHFGPDLATSALFSTDRVVSEIVSSAFAKGTVCGRFRISKVSSPRLSPRQWRAPR